MIKHLLYTRIVPALFACMIFSPAIQACSGVDIIITSLHITSITSGYYTYDYQVKNIGTTSIALKNISLQNYVSVDNTYGGGDPAANGSIISSSTTLLMPNETFSGSYGASSPGTVADYPYLLTFVQTYPETECDVSNDLHVAPIQLTGTRATETVNAMVKWNTDTKSFSVSDWSGSSATSSSLQYTVYSPSGTLMNTGTTAENQSTPLPAMADGMYILYLSDGQQVYSKKIVY